MKQFKRFVLPVVCLALPTIAVAAETITVTNAAITPVGTDKLKVSVSATAEGIKIGSFGVRLDWRSPEMTLPTGFLEQNGFWYLKGERSNSVLIDNSADDEDSTVGTLAKTFSVSGWPDGRYIFNVYADNRPADGPYRSGQQVISMMLEKGSWEQFTPEAAADLRSTAPGASVALEGGEIRFVDVQTVAEDPERHINFPFVFRFKDGTITMTHSLGLHTVTERTVRLMSTDNGKSWRKPGGVMPAFNSVMQGDGAAMVNSWNTKPAISHPVTTYHWDSPTSAPRVIKSTVTLPWPAILLAHRTLLEMPDGSWLLSAYGKLRDDKKDSAFVLKSADRGATWSYLSTIATGVSPGSEGYNEPAMVQLADGSLLAHVRTGGGRGRLMVQFRSTDGGATWGERQFIADYGVDPHIIRLFNGVLLSSAGRPGVYLLADFTGTGNHWQQVQIFDGGGSSYTSLIETSPGVVALFHDISGFNSANVAGGNRLLMKQYRVQPAR